jgi:hypothetical protein
MVSHLKGIIYIVAVWNFERITDRRLGKTV